MPSFIVGLSSFFSVFGKKILSFRPSQGHNSINIGTKTTSRTIFSCEDAAQQVLIYVCVCVSVDKVENVPQNVQECIQNVPECIPNVPECMPYIPECKQNIPECIQNVPESSRMLQNANRMFQNVP